MAANRPVLCHYYKQGCCKFGTSCTYSHDLSRAVEDKTCRFFLRGQCAYGDRCRYDHVRPRPATASSSVASFSTGPNSSSNNNNFKTKSTSSSSNFNGPTSFATAAASNIPTAGESVIDVEGSLELCPYGVKSGTCPLQDAQGPERCAYLHGDRCDVCGLLILHPFNEVQRADHKRECDLAFEADLNYSFAIDASRNKICGICLETVLDKEDARSRKFGILDCCTHCFCFSCISAWRQQPTDAMASLISGSADRQAIKSCPECRRAVTFVVRSDFYCDTSEAKKVLIDAWKATTAKKPCIWWTKHGNCRYAEKCFYSHEGPRGNPPKQRRRLYRDDGDSFDDEEHNFSEMLEAAMLGSINRRRPDLVTAMLTGTLDESDERDFDREWWYANCMMDFDQDSDDEDLNVQQIARLLSIGNAISQSTPSSPDNYVHHQLSDVDSFDDEDGDDIDDVDDEESSPERPVGAASGPSLTKHQGQRSTEGSAGAAASLHQGQQSSGSGRAFRGVRRH